MRRRAVGAGLVLALPRSAGGRGQRERRGRSRKPSRRRGSTSGRTTTAAGRRRTTQVGSRCRRRSGRRSMTTYKENVPEGPQVAQVIESLIRDGNKMIFATSFGFQTAMVAAAKKHPDVYFEMATGTATSKNMAEYFGAERGRDLPLRDGGGRGDEEGHIGYVVPFAIPEVIRHANAFVLGAQAMRPNAKVRLVWTNSWFDPKKERQAAESLVAAGVGRHRPERRQPVGRPVRGVEEDPVGRLQLGRAEVRADLVAHGSAVRLGRLLRPAREGGDERHVEDGLLLRLDEGRLHQARAVRQARGGEDAGGDQRQGRPRSSRAPSTSSPGPLYDQSGKLRVPKGKALTLKQQLRWTGS